MNNITRTLAGIVALVAICALASLPRLQAMPPVDQKTACLQCHGDLSAVFDLPHRHDPLDKGKCSECHNPHAAKHMDLLLDDEAALCARCHKDAASWSSRRTVHAPVAEGHCVTCHDPHASTESGLLKQSQRTLCATCHPAVNEWSRRAKMHSPVRQDNCDRCHTPHASDGEGLLVADQAALCLGCHQTTAAFTAVHKGFDPASSRCTACHDPHAGNDDSFLMANVHMPFADGDCGACHQAAPATGGGYPLKASTMQVCASCHGEVAADVQRFSAHGASEAQSCEMCHNAHASDESSLMSTSQRQLCTKCHQMDRMTKKTQADPHAGTSCGTCHAPHGSDQRFYLKAASLKLCAQCHSSQHHVSHPMGEGTRDPISGTELDCLSCHKLHGSETASLLLAEGDRDLCVRCHNK